MEIGKPKGSWPNRIVMTRQSISASTIQQPQTWSMVPGRKDIELNLPYYEVLRMLICAIGDAHGRPA